MHAEYLNRVIVNCRRRAAEGDCPTPPSFGVETLEEAVVALADLLANMAIEHVVAAVKRREAGRTE